MKKVLRCFIGFGLVLAVVLVFSACNYVEPPPAMGQTETVFFVALDDAEVRSTYETIRLTLIDAEGTQLALSTGPTDGKYKIILPQAAINETNKINFLIELKTQELLSDKIHTLAPNALARGYLRSRYVQITHNSVPGNAETINLTINNADLKVGYGPGHLKMADIPYIPDFFKIQLDLTSEGIEPLLDRGYTPALAVAIDTPVVPGSAPVAWNDPGLRFNLTSMPPIREEDVLGVASPDTGWFMIMEDEIQPNKPCRYWVFFVKDNDFTTSHLYYHIGVIPEFGGSITIEPDFAGIPIPDEATLKMLALNDAAREQISSTLPFDISDLSESFVLTSPVYDLSTDFWLPIGRDKEHPSGVGYSPFTGVFDGGKYLIWQIKLTGIAEHNNYGLFGNVENAKLQNFNISVNTQETLNFSSTLSADETNAGMLAGRAVGVTLKNINVLSGTFMVTRSGSAANRAGGVVGLMSGTDTNVSCSTTVLATGGSPINYGQKYGLRQ